MNKIDLDIIHAHSPVAAGQSAILYAQKRGIPLVGTFHSKYKDDILGATGMNMVAEVGAKLVVDFFDKCDEVWAVSESAADTLHGYGYKKRIIIMPNGTDTPVVDPSDRQKAAEAFGLGEETVFLYVGQQDWKKNIERILLAAQEIKRRAFPFKLVLVGMGPHAEEIRKRASHLGLDDKMVYTGHISDSSMLAGLYQCADLFVFPSLYDTAGLVVLEAATFGTPSVVVRGSSAAEVIKDGINGFLCEDDEWDLAHIMELAIMDSDKMHTVGEMARSTLPKGWNGLMDDVLERYDRLIKDYTKNSK